MPFLTGLQQQYEKYVEVNGYEQPSGSPWNPTFIPDPLGPVDVLLGGMVRR